MTNNGKKFLLTAARSTSTIDLARQLSLSGHQVYCADTTPWHICRLSNKVKKNFVIPKPRFETEDFLEELVRIVKEEGVDYLIPTYEEILYLSKALDRFPLSCKILCDDFNKLHHLHNKWLFYLKQKAFNIDVPKTLLIRSRKELASIPLDIPFVLKASYSRASQNLIKVDAETSYQNLIIESHNPWIAQEWLEGKKYCTYSVCYEGRVVAHSVYPVDFAIDGNSCINFQSIEHPKIFEWITTFVKLDAFTGQIGFDFIELQDGRLLAIECNPRATNGLILFTPEDRLDKALMNQTEEVILPKKGYRKQILMGMLMYGWKGIFKEKKILRYFKTIFRDKDVVLNPQDLKPFLFMPFLFIIYLFQKIKLHLTIPAMFLFDFNWNGEESLKELNNEIAMGLESKIEGFPISETILEVNQERESV